MKTTTLHLAFNSSVVMAAVLGAGHSVRANVEPRFQVLDLTALGFIPNPGAHGTVSINNKGQVAYSRMINDQMHGWVYLPTPAYGQPEGLLDLTVPVGESAAWDLNMSGLVVGQINGSQIAQGEAVAWQLAETVTACPLGFLSSPPSLTWSVAYAVNDANPPVVVGDSSLLGLFPCAVLNASFRVPFDGTCPAPVLELLGEFDPDDRGRYARDINTPANPQDLPQIVGFSGLEVQTCHVEDCLVSEDPLRWLNGAVAGLIRLPDGGGHQARGTNKFANIVGLGFDDTEQTVCLTRALFWLNDAANPFNLGTLPPLTPGQETRAEAINNRNRLQVVGTNLSTVEALLWEQDGAGGWDPVITLNDKVDPNSGWILRAGHDANDAGCIVGWGELEVQPGVFETHAFLLYECPADLDGDAVVGILDLLALLAAWGPCPDPPDPCPADLNGDGMVGILDLLQLLANWGTCCAGRNTAVPETVQDCVDKFCCDSERQLALQKCLCVVDPQSCE